MTQQTKTIKYVALISILTALAVSWRLVNHNFALAPNLEIVTSVTVLAALVLGFRAALILPIATMIVSDLFIGNSSIFVFTWGSFAIIGLGALLMRKLNEKPKLQILSSFGFAIASSFMFFAVTNFGVWLQGWYPMTLTGLVDCYIAAIPFYRTMLIGNLVFVPIVVSAWQLAKVRYPSVVNSLIGK
jgi:uncharacterized membrane protein